MITSLSISILRSIINVNNIFFQLRSFLVICISVCRLDSVHVQKFDCWSKLQTNSFLKEKPRDKHLINEIYFDTKSSCTYFVILIFHYNSCKYNNNILQRLLRFQHAHTIEIDLLYILLTSESIIRSNSNCFILRICQYLVILILKSKSKVTASVSTYYLFNFLDGKNIEHYWDRHKTYKI